MKTISPCNAAMALSVAFLVLLIAGRVIYSGTVTYVFLAWNVFLAIIPLIISMGLERHATINRKTMLLLFTWLIFLPNAPYIITDLFHFRERYPVPRWYDLLILVSASWIGLLLGFASLLRVEAFLDQAIGKRRARWCIVGCIFLCSYGIYIGRYLRFNSWDLLTDPLALFSEIARHCTMPLTYLSIWRFTFLFTALLSLFYYNLRQFHLVKRGS